jgi:hypothetical protein
VPIDTPFFASVIPDFHKELIPLFKELPVMLKLTCESASVTEQLKAAEQEVNLGACLFVLRDSYPNDRC